MRCILVMCQTTCVWPRTISVQLRSKRVDFVCNSIQATLAQDHFVPQKFDKHHTFLLPLHYRRCSHLGIEYFINVWLFTICDVGWQPGVCEISFTTMQQMTYSFEWTSKKIMFWMKQKNSRKNTFLKPWYDL